MLTRIQPKRFSDEIAEQILGLIKKGKLKPGDTLPSEREMASSLGVSPPPLREGLKKLETLGFIEIQPRRKIVVKSITGKSMQDPLAQAIEGDIDMVVQLLEVRKILESWAASRAAQRADKAHIMHLQEVFEELEKDFETDTLGVDADARFHLAIYEATGNTILCHIGFTIFDILWQSQKLTRETMFKEQENKRRLLEQHQAIFQAIKDGNPRKARSAILSHLNFAKKKILELAS
ncbi:MAG: GntR family transcriptional regulator [Deltaproteobacteria bacterium]|nr:MAG: GntR family transcriptional regulator [Deltaproteobacteria bacterium]